MMEDSEGQPRSRLSLDALKVEGLKKRAWDGWISKKVRTGYIIWCFHAFK